MQALQALQARLGPGSAVQARFVELGVGVFVFMVFGNLGHLGFRDECEPKSTQAEAETATASREMGLNSEHRLFYCLGLPSG